MVISEYQRKTNVCRFCEITQIIFFFGIPKVCWTVYAFHFLNLECLKRMYDSLFTFRDFRHRRTIILKVERTLKRAKTMERNSTTCECIFHQLAVKNVNVNVVITIYCQHNSIFFGQKNYSIRYLTGQNQGLPGLKNHDRQPAVHYFQPWHHHMRSGQNCLKGSLKMLVTSSYKITFLKRQCYGPIKRHSL